MSLTRLDDVASEEEEDRPWKCMRALKNKPLPIGLVLWESRKVESDWLWTKGTEKKDF